MMREWPLVAIATAITTAGLLLPEFYVSVLNYIGLYSIVALGIVLITGIAGVMSFGQAAFVGIGAYTTAVLTVQFGMSPWLGLIAGLGLTGLSALSIGALTLRLSGHYLPLSTIAWSISLYYLFGNIEGLGGHTGLSGIPAIGLFSVSLDSGRKIYFLIWIVVIATIVLARNLLNSRPGRAMRALKTAQTAESFGVNTAWLKVVVFVYAALLACVSGWLYAHMLRFVNPTPFSLTMGIEYLFMAVVGGASHVWGALLGASLVTLLKEYLQDALPAIVGRSGNFEIIVFGLVVLFLLHAVREKGLGGVLFSYFGASNRGEPPKEAAPLQRENRDQARLRVSGIEKRFGGLTALNQISFEVGASEVVALIGPNGAGKTTLFNVITAHLRADSGAVWFRDERIDMLHGRDIVRRGIARTFQHVRLIPELTVMENAMLGAHWRTSRGSVAASFGVRAQEERKIEWEALRQLERVGLAEVKHEQGSNLALGQQRLLEIARALCADPALLLLDEPAAGLRFKEKQELADLIRSLRDDGMGVLLVEHDMDFVMNLADRVLVMNFGEMLAEGTPVAVQTNPRVIEAYLGSAAA